MLALHEAMLAAGLESPYTEWLKQLGRGETGEDKGDRITTRVPCGEYFEVRDDALRAHATQVDPDGFWFRGAAGDPAARSGRPKTSSWPVAGRQPDLPESDLFAGIRETMRTGTNSPDQPPTTMWGMSALHLLAENNFGDTRSGGLAGPMGLFIIVLMAIATVCLIRNMNARIKRLPAEFPDTELPKSAASGPAGADEQAEGGSPDGESPPAR